jgi:hypothetical protein
MMRWFGRVLCAGAAVMLTAAPLLAQRPGVLSLRVRMNQKPVPVTVAPGAKLTVLGWTPLVSSLPDPMGSVDARVKADGFPPVGITYPADTEVDTDILLGQFLVRKTPPGFTYTQAHQAFGPIEFENGSTTPALLTFQCGGAGAVTGSCVFTIRTSVK